eukprot:scaffold187933_cov29-Tisochrysis_lutea.AAC.1
MRQPHNPREQATLQGHLPRQQQKRDRQMWSAPDAARLDPPQSPALRPHRSRLGGAQQDRWAVVRAAVVRAAAVRAAMAIVAAAFEVAAGAAAAWAEAWARAEAAAAREARVAVMEVSAVLVAVLARAGAPVVERPAGGLAEREAAMG